MKLIMEELATLAAMIVMALPGFFLLSVWIWSLINIFQRRDLSGSQKIGWWAVCLFLNFFGGLLYYFLGKPKYQA